jgi:hypothetical protein
MSADKTDIDDAVFVVNSHNHAVLVAFDVEHRPVVGNKADVALRILHIRRRLPVSLLHVRMPCLQGLLRISMLLPEFPEGLFGNDLHGNIIRSDSLMGTKVKNIVAASSFKATGLQLKVRL